MSEPTMSAAAGSGQLRTLAVRITDDMRAQLDIVAQLNERTVTDEIRVALEFWIDKTKSDPAILKKAQQVQAEIERKAQTQRGAIAAIFGNQGTAPAETASDTPKSATRKTKPAGE